jgi:hypothetical protein
MKTKAPMKVYRDRTGVPVGTLTLCEVCGYAVRLGLVKMRSPGPGRPYAWYEMWQHSGQYGVGAHDIELPRWVIR